MELLEVTASMEQERLEQLDKLVRRDCLERPLIQVLQDRPANLTRDKLEVQGQLDAQA